MAPDSDFWHVRFKQVTDADGAMSDVLWEWRKRALPSREAFGNVINWARDMRRSGPPRDWPNVDYGNGNHLATIRAATDVLAWLKVDGNVIWVEVIA